MRHLFTVIICGLAFAQCQAVEPVSQDTIRRLAVPNDAYVLALADLQKIPLEIAPLIRYIWVPGANTQDIQVVTEALNDISRASNLLRPALVANGQLLRIRIDLLAPAAKDQVEWIDTWEQLRFDPFFNILLPKQVVTQILKLPKSAHPICRVKWEGKFHETPLSELDLTGVDVVRIAGGHLDPITVATVQALTVSAAPIVDYRYFLWRSETTIQDSGSWKVIYGGLYYEFIGVKTAKQAGTKGTDEDLFFSNLGIGDAKNGISAEQALKDLPSENRGAIFKSNVTGKPRRWDLINSRLGRPLSNIAIVSITHDIRDQDTTSLDSNPLKNLVKIKDAAREVLWTHENGTQRGVLFDGNGVLQREVPPDIATNRMIPDPNSPRLEPNMGCKQCHRKSGFGGWQPLSNDVTTLLKKRKLDIFGDLTQLNRSLAETNDEIAAQYLADPTVTLQRLREDQNRIGLRITGPWKDGANDFQVNVAEVSAKHLVGVYQAHRYDPVTPRKALRELGFDVPDAKAVELLNTLLPQDRESEFGGVIPEDVSIGALKEGLPIPRELWDQAYAFAAVRAMKSLAKMKESLPQSKEGKK
jgi:hypothetical protein